MFSFAGYGGNSRKIIIRLEEDHCISPDELIPNISDFCASLEYSMGYFIARRVMRGLEYAENENFWPENAKKTLVVSGGVASNLRLRHMLQQACDQFDCQAVFPPVKYCTDNGVMIAWNGVEKWKRSREEDIIPWQKVFDVDVYPKVPFGQDISSVIASQQLKAQKIKFNF